jgi:anti-sigma regulatory factor (Ser/Thr protein kinase)
MPSNHVRHRLSATPDAVPQARRLIREFVDRACPNAAEIHDDVALALSEAVGNVVRHAYGRRPGPLEVNGRVDGHELHLEVRDWGTTGEGHDPGLGLGLPLMRSLGDVHVVHPDDGGWLVHMRFACVTLPEREHRHGDVAGHA